MVKPGLTRLVEDCFVCFLIIVRHQLLNLKTRAKLVVWEFRTSSGAFTCIDGYRYRYLLILGQHTAKFESRVIPTYFPEVLQVAWLVEFNVKSDQTGRVTGDSSATSKAIRSRGGIKKDVLCSDSPLYLKPVIVYKEPGYCHQERRRD